MIVPDRIVIINDFSSAEGGAGYLATSLARGLSQQGIPVTFISGDEGRAMDQDVDNVPLGGRRLLDDSAIGAAIRGLWNAEPARVVRRWIQAKDTPRTIYHLHNWSNILSPAVFDALAPVAHRCVIHAHDFFLVCPNGAFLDYPRAAVCDLNPLSTACVMTNCDKRAYPHKIWRVARQRVLKPNLSPHLAAATFVAIHPAMLPWLNRGIRPVHITAIRNPVTPFGPVVPAPEKQTRLVHIGQVQRLKGVYELAEAGRRLKAGVDFFGSGEDLDDLRARYPEHAFHGHTAHADLNRHLQKARAAVVATQSPEPFCLAAFEAAATGLPLVVSDAILAAPELEQTGASLLFAAGNIGALTEVLGKVLADDDLVARLAAAAREIPHGNGLPDWLAAHSALYSEVLNRAETTMEGKRRAV